MGRPTIIRGCRRILHGGDYAPGNWGHDPAIIGEDRRLMRLAGCNTFTVGVFTWTDCEPADGVFVFDWLDRTLDRLAEDGHRAVLATPSGAKPAWLAARHPEVRRADAQGHRAPVGGRHNHCWTSPVYRARVLEVNRRLAERYGGHPALGLWHVSNELCWECMCELCLGAFRSWLRERHGSLEELNRCWWTSFWSHTFTDWGQIDPRDGSIDGLQLDWRRFKSWQAIDFFRHEAAPLRELSPTVPCTTNFMSLHPYMDYAAFAREVDVVADDQYPCYDAEHPDLPVRAAAVSFKHDLLRRYRPDQPFMLMECSVDAVPWARAFRPKPSSLHRAEMLQAVGHGAEGLLCFQWRKDRGGCEKLHGAIVDHAGHEGTRVFRGVAALGADLERLAPVLGSTLEAQVAVVYDPEAAWGFETSHGPRTRVAPGERPSLAPHGAVSAGPQTGVYLLTCLKHHRPFWELAIPVDGIGSQDALAGYRLVLAPHLWLLRPGVAEALRAYVAGGGTLIATYHSGIVDEHNRCLTGGWPGQGLMEVFGLWNEETEELPAGRSRTVRFTADAPPGLEGRLQVPDVCAICHARGAEVLATVEDGLAPGCAALTRHRYGKGQAWYLAVDLPADALLALYGHLAASLGISRLLTGPPQGGVGAQLRRGEQEEFLFLQNFAPAARQVHPAGAGWRPLLGDPGPAPGVHLAPASALVLHRSR